MFLKNKAILLCGFVVFLSGIPEVSYAKWSSSSSPSRSVSPKNYSTRAITRSIYSGFGSKSYQNQKINSPVSLGNKNTDNIFSKQAQKQQTIKDYDGWKNKKVVVPPPIPTNNTSTIPLANTSNNNTKIVNRTYVTRNYNYGGHSYVMPSYYTPTHNSYGNVSSFFLGMLLAKATEPSYYNWAYAHYNDPSYIQWHQEMEEQARTNSDLESKLSTLDAKVEQLKIDNANPVTLTKADSNMESDPDIKNVSIPTDISKPTDIKNSFLSNFIVGLGSLILFIGIVIFILL